MTDDELEALLTPPPHIRPSPELLAALFRRSERLLARERFVRRLRRAGAVAAVFAAGGLAGWVAKPDRERVTTVEVAVASPPEVVTVTVVVPVPGAPGAVATNPGADTPGSPRTPADAELLAEQADDRAEAARLYRLAGDLYLNDRQDYRQAARCYRLYLSRAGAAGLALRSDDSWLLTSLKNAAYKEKSDATTSGG